MNKNSLAYSVIFTFAAAFFFVLILSAANTLTLERVRENEKTAVYTAFLSSIGIETKESSEAASLFENYFPGVDYYDMPRVLEAEIQGERLILTAIRGSGVWGTITGVLALDSGLERITGLEIITHNETPGLGGRIDEKWFKDQFAGMKIPSAGINVRKGTGTPVTDRESGVVDGITGATGTSSAIERMVNAAVADLRKGGRE